MLFKGMMVLTALKEWMHSQDTGRRFEEIEKIFLLGLRALLVSRASFPWGALNRRAGYPQPLSGGGYSNIREM
jgi:hypothetical protein